MAQIKTRKCGDCGILIPFQIFLRDNPTISMKRAQELWNDPFIIPYCPQCFLNRPEKPYRRRKRYYYNDRLKMRK
ncbi:MAG: hypothetical protein ACFE8B_06400 [Candidatus Hermodarchaeota archaeon]